MTDEQRRKVVLHYLYSGLGGPGGVFFSLVEGDQQKEFDYRAVFCGIEDLREEYRSNCTRLNIPFDYLRKKRGLALGAYFKVFRLFRKNRPDTLFLHGVSFSIVPAFWYKITRPRTRIIVRDTQAHHLKSKSEWFWMFIDLLLCNRMVFLTQESADGIKKRFGWWARRKKFAIIPNGLKMEDYEVATAFVTGETMELGMQSRMQPIKDHPALLKAFRLLKDKNPGKKIHLQIAGDGETLPGIKKMADELGLSNDIQFHGMLNGPALLKMMRSLHIYVHATMGETLSNSIMQAMASGLPIVASDVWGVNNMITHDRNGLLYAPGNEEQLATELDSLVNDPDLRARLGHTARRYAEMHYDNAVMFRRYAALY